MLGCLLTLALPPAVGHAMRHASVGRRLAVCGRMQAARQFTNASRHGARAIRQFTRNVAGRTRALGVRGTDGPVPTAATATH